VDGSLVISPFLRGTAPDLARFGAGSDCEEGLLRLGATGCSRDTRAAAPAVAVAFDSILSVTIMLGCPCSDINKGTTSKPSDPRLVRGCRLDEHGTEGRCHWSCTTFAPV
jgi:hypothetical protein